jgi:drug/metabolite transporter (DMT)-like permease
LGAPLQDIAISVGMGALTLTGGMYLYTLGSRVVPAAQATLLSLVEVLLAPVWAWVALGEGLSPNTALGGAVLMAAVGVNAALGLKNPAQSRA